MTLPSGYTQLEYIQSSGTQYIDTGFQPNSNTRVVIECEPTETVSAQNAVFGARNSNSGQASLAYGFNIMTSTSCRSDYMGSNATISGTYSSGTRMSVDMNKNVCTVNGKTGTNTAKTGQQTPYNLFLFNVNNVGTPHSSFAFKGKVYSCQIYDNGTLIRDFVPCKNSSGTAGLYDAANSKFYTNAGSGTFTQGNVVSDGGSSGGGTPAEGHNTMVGGKVYAVSGGKTMAGGKVYSIANGKTMVGGKSYEIAFGSGKIRVIISGSGTTGSAGLECYVQVGGYMGKKYSSAATIEVEPGTSLACYAKSSYGGSIYLNGDEVESLEAGQRAIYTIRPQSGTVSIELRGAAGTSLAFIYITTTS